MDRQTQVCLPDCFQDPKFFWKDSQKGFSCINWLNIYWKVVLWTGRSYMWIWGEDKVHRPIQIKLLKIQRNNVRNGNEKNTIWIPVWKKPMKKQAVPRKVSICCSIIISYNKNKPRGSGFSLLLQATDEQVFMALNWFLYWWKQIKEESHAGLVREGMLAFLEMQKDTWINWIWCGPLF